MSDINKKFKVITLGEMSEVFENMGVSDVLSLPRTADVTEMMVNTISESLEGTEYEFSSLVDTEEGLSAVLKLKES